VPRNEPTPATQSPLFDVARARNSWRKGGRFVRDPSPSFEAAQSISTERLTDVQDRILVLFKIMGPMPDDTLISYFEEYYPNRATDQSIRSRRAELVKRGLVRDSGRDGKSKHGNRCTVWEAT